MAKHLLHIRYCVMGFMCIISFNLCGGGCDPLSVMKDLFSQNLFFLETLQEDKSQLSVGNWLIWRKLPWPRSHLPGELHPVSDLRRGILALPFWSNWEWGSCALPAPALPLGLAAAFSGTASQLSHPLRPFLLPPALPLLALLFREFPHKVLLAHFCLTICFPRTQTWNNPLSKQP